MMMTVMCILLLAPVIRGLGIRSLGPSSSCSLNWGSEAASAYMTSQNTTIIITITFIVITIITITIIITILSV